MKAWIVDHARGFYWGMVLCFAAFAAALVLTGLAPWLAFLIYMICSFAGILAVNFLAYGDLRAAIKALDQDCDPDPLLELSQSVLRQNPKSLLYGVYEAFVLLHLNRRPEAAERLAPLEKDKRLWKNPGLLQVYCGCRADLSDAEEAAVWLDRLEEKAGKAPGTAKLLKQQRALLALRRGETEGLEPLFQTCLSEAETLRGVLAWRWSLARLYLLQGRKDEAREHLRYVAEHGNKLYVRSQAEEALGRLDACTAEGGGGAW